MKKNYQNPTLKIIEVENDQIIVCSSAEPSISKNEGLSDIRDIVETL